MRTKGKPRKERRPRGRPRDDANQRERLIDAALDSYATHGIAATSMRSVAAAAGVTPALVNYYFGSKERLLTVVIEERLMPVVAIMRQGIESAGEDPHALAAAFVRGVHAAVDRHPWLPSLWLREILSESGALRKVLLEEISPLVPRLLVERLRGAERHHELPAGVDPRLLVVSLVGLTLFPLAAAPLWRHMFAADDVGGDTLLRHTLALLDRGLGGSDAL